MEKQSVQITSATIIEQRKEFMVSPTGSLPTLRNAHFLKPSVTSIDGPSLKLPALTPKPIWSLDVTFNGWRNPLKKWNIWLENMHSRYNTLWKETGIYDALMCSNHKITRDNDLMFGLAERWCPETNTFFFPWGESTITLEDVLILGGFSVLGGHFLMPLQNQELIEIETFLEKSCKDVEKNSNIDCHSKWLNMFMDSGSQFEHEAFLSLWLSRFVFADDSCHDRIGSCVFPIAIHLARGSRLALAPAILASIYRDLGLLKGTMYASKLNEVDTLFITLWSALSLVQVWAWERLPPLQPKPNFLHSDMVRLARWDGVQNPDIGNVRPAIISAGSSFLWRPYTIALDNWSLPKFYKEKEMWLKGKNLMGDLESFVRCLRTCLLVGIDCQEPYNPHRVAMQFGLDQDLPGWVPRVHTTPDIAWYDYSKPLSDDEILYVPSRLFESDVTTRYLDWWRKTVLCPVNPVKGLVKGRRSFRKPLLRPWKQIELGSNQDVPPQILPARRPKKEKQKKKILLAPKVDKNTANKSMQESIVLKTANDPETPPGFPSKNGIKTTGQPLNPCIEKGVSSTTQSVENVDKNEDVLKNDVKKGKSNSKARKFKTMDKLLGVPTRRSPKKQKSNSTAEPLQTLKRIRSNEKGSRGSNDGSIITKKLSIKSITGAEYIQVVSKQAALMCTKSDGIGDNSSNLNSAVVTDINARLLRLESELAVLKGKDNIWTNEPGLNNQKNKL